MLPAVHQDRLPRIKQVSVRHLPVPLGTATPVSLPRLPSDKRLDIKPGHKKRSRASASADYKTPPLLPQASAHLLWTLSSTILQSNGSSPVDPLHSYKLYVGSGNNDQLVARLMKRRWFWTRVDSWQVADFVWTQHRITEILHTIPSSDVTLTPGAAKVRIKVPRAVRLQAESRPTGLELITQAGCLVRCEELPGRPRLYNRLERNFEVTSKRGLLLNLKRYYEGQGREPFAVLPLTYLVEEPQGDVGLEAFKEAYTENSMWIIKPGENTNCGHGIHVSRSLEDIVSLVQGAGRAHRRSFLIQKYLESPLLIHKRKFDIRCYALVTCCRGHVQAYFYHDGYLRTSSREFSTANVDDRFVHLTNDAVQKTAEDYGRFENGNKLSYPEFQKYLDQHHRGVDFWTSVWPQIREVVIDTVKATWERIDPSRRANTFEVLGYDFMVDSAFHVWLLEVNTNPCLALSSAYLARLIPDMLDNAFRIAVDPYFQEPPSKKHDREWAAQPFENRFELVFSSLASE